MDDISVLCADSKYLTTNGGRRIAAHKWQEKTNKQLQKGVEFPAKNRMKTGIYRDQIRHMDTAKGALKQKFATTLPDKSNRQLLL